ncbi:MAG TPA: hypothetical protein VH186_37325 [Chloroflexia bacterium]|nr:hypothetical protein [Chloroflexia bacterium]
MSQDKEQAPASPETQPAEVREELDQEQITHEGSPLRGSEDKSDYERHMGAMEDNVTSVMPPVEGPANLTGSEGEEDSDVNPRSELTPG